MPRVFQKLGLAREEALEATNALAGRIDLRKLKAGSPYVASFNPDAGLASFQLAVEGSGRAELSRAGGGWEAVWRPCVRSSAWRALRGTLEGSLEASIQVAGGPAALAYRMAGVLQWDLDFHRDLRRGDQFQVLYEEVQLDGTFHAIGDIVGLVYVNQGRTHEAYRFGDSSVYYDGEGRPMRKMFLRAPLAFTHVTSPFSANRLHPVLGVIRPHNGVDYAAPVGTPVQATANGLVTFAGWDGGGGNVVKLQHGSGYTTAYLHLSRFASGIRPGVHVRQGDTIAYTGATGLATGPHLDYRVKRNDQWLDPLSLKGLRDEPVPATRLASFTTWREAVRSNLQRSGVVAALVLPWQGAAGHRIHETDRTDRNIAIDAVRHAVAGRRKAAASALSTAR